MTQGSKTVRKVTVDSEDTTKSDVRSLRKRPHGMVEQSTGNTKTSTSAEGTQRKSRAKNSLLNPSKGKQKRVLSPRTREDEMLMRQFGVIPSRVCLEKVSESSESSSRDSADVGSSGTAKANTNSSSRSREVSTERVRTSPRKTPTVVKRQSPPKSADSGITADFSDDDDNGIVFPNSFDLTLLDDNSPIKEANTTEIKEDMSKRNLSQSFGVISGRQHQNKSSSENDESLLKKFGIKRLRVDVSPPKSNVSTCPNKTPSKTSPQKSKRQDNVFTKPSVSSLTTQEMDQLLKKCGMAISVPKPTDLRSSPRKRPSTPDISFNKRSESPEPSTSAGHGHLKRKRTARKSCQDEDLIKKFKLKDSSVKLECLSKIEISMLRNRHSNFGKSSWLQTKFDTDSESEIEWDIPSPPVFEEFVEDSASLEQQEQGKDFSETWYECSKSKTEHLESKTFSGIKKKKIGPKSKCIDQKLLDQFKISNPKINLVRVNSPPQNSNSDKELLKKFGIPKLSVVADPVDSGSKKAIMTGSPHKFTLKELQSGMNSAFTKLRSKDIKKEKSAPKMAMIKKNTGENTHNTGNLRTVKSDTKSTSVKTVKTALLVKNIKPSPTKLRQKSGGSVKSGLTKAVRVRKHETSLNKQPHDNKQSGKCPKSKQSNTAVSAQKISGRAKKTFIKSPDQLKKTISKYAKMLPDVKVSISMLSADEISKYQSSSARLDTLAEKDEHSHVIENEEKYLESTIKFWVKEDVLVKQPGDLNIEILEQIPSNAKPEMDDVVKNDNGMNVGNVSKTDCEDGKVRAKAIDNIEENSHGMAKEDINIDRVNHAEESEKDRIAVDVNIENNDADVVKDNDVCETVDKNKDNVTCERDFQERGNELKCPVDHKSDKTDVTEDNEKENLENDISFETEKVSDDHNNDDTCKDGGDIPVESLLIESDTKTSGGKLSRSSSIVDVTSSEVIGEIYDTPATTDTDQTKVCGKFDIENLLEYNIEATSGGECTTMDATSGGECTTTGTTGDGECTTTGATGVGKCTTTGATGVGECTTTVATGVGEGGFEQREGRKMGECGLVSDPSYDDTVINSLLEN